MPQASQAVPARSSGGRNPVSRSPGSRLVITVVVDQLAAWVAASRFDALPATGGFARLRREGTYVEDLRYAHALTDTAPGHAALYTGATPRVSGITRNEVFDDASGKKVSVLRDVATKVVSHGGVGTAAGSSLAALLVSTLADQLHAEFRAAPVVSLSVKDRGALFGGGRHPSAVLWFDCSIDGFVTSTAFASAVPTWASAGSPAAVKVLRDPPWNPLDVPWLRTHAATPDEQVGEGDWEGLGVSFPHRVGTARAPNVAWRATPYADEAVLRMALAAVDAEHMGRTGPALLALSLSSNDYVGHVFGPDSWEAWDNLRRLDAGLGAFFEALDQRLGPEGYAVMLSGDHGTTTLPEAADRPGVRPWCQGDAAKVADRWERSCGPLTRVLPDKLADDLRKAASQAVGPGTWVAGVAEPYVFLAPDARALPPLRRRALDDALRSTLAATPEVEGVVDVAAAGALDKPCPAGEGREALLCQSLRPTAEAPLYLLLRRGAFFDPSYAMGKGLSHGSPYLHDRAVPLLVRAPGRVPAGRVVREPLPFGAFARTGASLLGVTPPPAARDAKDLAAP